MTHEEAELHRYTGALGRFLERQDVFGACGMWFLYQHVLACGDRVEDHGITGGRIHRQEDGFQVLVGEQILVRSVQTRDALLTAHPAQSLLDQVADRDDVEQRAGTGRTDGGMTGPSAAHYAEPNRIFLLCHCLIFSHRLFPRVRDGRIQGGNGI